MMPSCRHNVFYVKYRLCKFTEKGTRLLNKIDRCNLFIHDLSFLHSIWQLILKVLSAIGGLVDIYQMQREMTNNNKELMVIIGFFSIPMCKKQQITRMYV